jgi:hypothetical protein
LVLQQEEKSVKRVLDGKILPFYTTMQEGNEVLPLQDLQRISRDNLTKIERYAAINQQTKE